MTATGTERPVDQADEHLVQKRLETLRGELDRLDPALITLLGRRIDIARDVAAVKAAHDIPVMQHERVRLVKERNARLGIDAGLDPDFVERIFALIIDEMCRIEDAIVSGG